MSRSIGIDIGNTRIRTVVMYDEAVYGEETAAVAVNEAEKKIVACGDDALALAERVPGSVKIVYPFIGNATPDPAYAYMMMSYILKKTRSKGADVFLSVAGEQSRKTDSLYLNALKNAGDVITVDSTFAAMRGCGIKDAADSVIVNIGHSVTDIAVYYNGNAEKTLSVTHAGAEFDKAIMAYLYKQHHAKVTEQEADRIKREIGTLNAVGDGKTAYCCLRQALGLPKNMNVGAPEISSALEPVFDELADSVLDALRDLRYKPDKLILTGGGALLDGIAQSLVPLVCMPVEVAEDPQHAVIRGLCKIMEEQA